eukprot:ANDGO_03022.mRNA.1 Transcription factor GAMYB
MLDAEMTQSDADRNASLLRQPSKRWNAEEDAKLLDGVRMFGENSWTAIAQYIGTHRPPNACSQRFRRVLDPKLVRDQRWTFGEYVKLAVLFRTYGPRWSVLSAHLPGRHDTAVRFRWLSISKRAKAAIRAGVKHPLICAQTDSQHPSEPTDEHCWIERFLCDAKERLAQDPEPTELFCIILSSCGHSLPDIPDSLVSKLDAIASLTGPTPLPTGSSLKRRKRQHSLGSLQSNEDILTHNHSLGNVPDNDPDNGDGGHEDGDEDDCGCGDDNDGPTASTNARIVCDYRPTTLSTSSKRRKVLVDRIPGEPSSSVTGSPRAISCPSTLGGQQVSIEEGCPGNSRHSSSSPAATTLGTALDSRSPFSRVSLASLLHNDES